MAISLVGSNTNAAAAANVTIDLSGIAIQEGDVVYVASCGNGNDLDVTEDSGTYSQLADLFADDSSNTNFSVWRKVQGATPDTTVTINSGGGAVTLGLAYVLRGVDNTTPEDATPVTDTDTGGVGTPNPPAITTVTAGAWVLPFVGSSEGDAVTNPPTDYTDLVDTQGATSFSIAVARREIATAGPEDPGTYGDIVGTTSDSWCACTVAVRPAVGEALTGTTAQTLPMPTQAATGAETFIGATSQVLPMPTQSATGTSLVNVTGTAAQALPVPSQAAAGTGGAAAVTSRPTYGAAPKRSDYEARVRVHWERIEAAERQEQARRERVAELQRQQAEVEAKAARRKQVAQASAVAKRRAKLAREIAALQAEQERAAAEAAEMRRMVAEIEAVLAAEASALIDRRRRMMLVVSLAATAA